MAKQLQRRVRPAPGLPAMSLEANDMHLQPGPFAEGWTGWLLEGFLHGERAVFKVAAHMRRWICSKLHYS